MQLRQCADEVHAVKDKYGATVFILAMIDWTLRKIAARLRIIPQHGYWRDAFIWWFRRR